MNLEENAECIVAWVLMIISSILCCFYVYFQCALRRAISATAPGEALRKASVFNVRYTLFHFETATHRLLPNFRQ